MSVASTSERMAEMPGPAANRSTVGKRERKRMGRRSMPLEEKGPASRAAPGNRRKKGVE